LRHHVADLLRRYHYRGFHGAVGDNVRYLARDVRGRELAVMVFGAAAWKAAARDRFLGWWVTQRQQRLGALANQQRFWGYTELLSGAPTAPLAASAPHPARERAPDRMAAAPWKQVGLQIRTGCATGLSLPRRAADPPRFRD
jgi:hypothetical protein